MKRVAVLVLSIAPVAFCDDFWKSKEPSQWSDKDVRKMLMDSPWTRSTTIDVPGVAPSVGGGAVGRRGGPPRAVGGDMGGDMGSPSEINLPEGGGRGGRGGGMGAAPMPPAPRALIQWASAAPVREAAIKAEAGAVTPEAAAKFYVIRASGLPMSVMGRPAPGDEKQVMEQLRQALLKATSLTPKGKDSIAPLRVDLMPGRRDFTILYLFPRTVIAAADKEVEFKSALGRTRLETKFKLKDMAYRGELAL